MPHHSIQDPTTLRRILDAMLLIEADLDLPVLLHHLTQEAQSMTGARYGALGVLNHDRSGLSELITVGLDADQEERIRPRPAGRGLWPPHRPSCAAPLGATRFARGELRVSRRPPSD